MTWLTRIRDHLATSRQRAEAGGDGRQRVVVAALVEAFPDPVLLLDGRGVVAIANTKACALLGVAEARGPVSFLLREPDLLEAIDQAASGGVASQVRYYSRVPIDRWFEAHVAPLPGGVGAPGGVLVVLHDLTQAEQLERMRADFVANASHELRTPLASLSGFIETLQGPARSDAAARDRFLAIMKAQATRMSRLIDDLLSLSRIELDEHVRPQARVDLGEVAAQVVDGLRAMAATEQVEVTLERRGAVPMLGAPDELARLIENLVENAIKYAASGRRVVVRAAVERDGGEPRAVLSVRDFGPGIAPEHLPRLTERFYRVDVGESRSKGGTGLGLAIVKHIVSRHRGTLAIESTPGDGATFIVRFDPAD